MFEELIADTVDTLLAQPYFGDAPGIPVLDERIGEIDSMVERAIAKIGHCVFVGLLSASTSREWENVLGPFYDDIVLGIIIFEMPTLNDQNNQDGTGKTSRTTAENVASALHMHQPFEDGSPLIHVSTVRFAEEGEEARTGFNLRFTHRGGLSTAGRLKVEQPEISVVAGTATITTDTAGASIFYSVNGNEPSPTSGIFYTAPFSVGSGVTIKTRAYLAGYLTSKQASVTT